MKIKKIDHNPENEAEANAIKQAFGIVCNALTSETISFTEFIRPAWAILEPSTLFIPNWHIDYIAEHLEAVITGKIKRLCINLPPRHMKSLLVSVMFPAWAWTRYPWYRFLGISYAANLSLEHNKKRRDLIESAWYQNRWGGSVTMKPDQNQKTEFENMSAGAMFATSIQGVATGKGADIILIDDAINPEQSESKLARERARDFIGRTLSTRLNDKKNGIIIEVSQRTHVNDVTDKLISDDPSYTHLSIDAIAEERTMIIFPMSGRTMIREIGDILCSTREDKPVLDKQRQTMGSRSFNAQYQQKPQQKGGNLIKTNWWRFYDEEPAALAQQMDFLAQSWDMSFKGTDESSFVVGLMGGRRGPDFYVFEEERDRMDFPTTIKRVLRFHERWPGTQAIYVEDKANGPAVIQTLSRKIPGFIAVKSDISKEARMTAASPVIESGNTYLPNPYDANSNLRPERQWVIEFIDEVEHFPGKPNDRGDALSQLLLKLMDLDLRSNESFVDVDEGDKVLMGLYK